MKLVVEQYPRMEGRQMVMMISPEKALIPVSEHRKSMWERAMPAIKAKKIYRGQRPATTV